MNLELFSSPEYENYQVRVIAPAYTYNTVTSFTSDYEFEFDYFDYDMSRKWEYLVVVDNETLASFDNLKDTCEYIENTDFDFYLFDLNE